MGMIVAVAIYGAALGFLIGPRLRSVVFAAGSVGVVQYGALWFSQIFERQPGMESIASAVRAILAPHPEDLASLVSAAAISACVAAILSGIFRSGEQRRRGRRVSVLED